MNDNIGNIINQALSQSSPNVIRRKDYSPQMNYLQVMDLFERIGKQREPDFTIDKFNKFAFTNIAKWLIGDPTMEALDVTTRQRKLGDLRKGIFLTGQTGTGKSMLMEIVSQVAKELRLGYWTGSSGHFLYYNCYRSDKITTYFSNTGDIESLTSEHRVLCIQDLGSEPAEVNYMGSKVNVLRQIIETRYDDRTKITHFTSNLSLRDKDTITARYGDRVYDRLRGGCNYLEIAGGSRR